jgi:hypothetical protein
VKDQSSNARDAKVLRVLGITGLCNGQLKLRRGCHREEPQGDVAIPWRTATAVTHAQFVERPGIASSRRSSQ